MKNQPERLQERMRALEDARSEIRIVSRMKVPLTPAMERHRRNVSLLQMVVAEPELGVRIQVCDCTGFTWPHALHLSTRCLGR